jgi:hypothetical protein
MSPADKRAARQRLEERKQITMSCIRSEETTIQLTEKLVNAADAKLALAQREYEETVAKLLAAPQRLADLRRSMEEIGREEKRLEYASTLERMKQLEGEITALQAAPKDGQAFVDARGTFHCPNGHKHSRGPLDGVNLYRCFGCPTDNKSGPKTYRVSPEHDQRVAKR